MKIFLFRTFFFFAVIAMPSLAIGAFGDTDTFVSKLAYGDGKNRLDAFFDFPYGFAMKQNGAMIIADTYNNKIRKITSTGKVKTVAGTGSVGLVNGARQQAEFFQPHDVDVSHGIIAVADTENGAIRKIVNGRVRTLTTDAGYPEGVIIAHRSVFFTDSRAGTVKKVSLRGGSVTTVARGFSSPQKLVLSEDAAFAYVVDSGHRQLKRVHLSSGAVTTIAGSGRSGTRDGACRQARFTEPGGVYATSEYVFVADRTGSQDLIRRIDLDDCTITTITTDEDTFSLGYPRDVIGRGEDVYMLLTGFSRIEKIRDATDLNAELILPTHFAGKNRFQVQLRNPVLVGRPKNLALSPNKRTLYIAENNRIRKLRFGSKRRSTLVAGSVIDNYARTDDRVFVGERARFSDITAIVVSKNGEYLYVVDRNNNRIRKVHIRTGAVSYLTGAGITNSTGADNGIGSGRACPNEQDLSVSGCAYFNRPMGAVLSKNGRYLYVTDTGNNAIRRVTVMSHTPHAIGRVVTIAGSRSAGYADGFGRSARFSAPIGITRNKQGTALFVADRNNHVIRKIALHNNRVTTIAGTPGHNGYLEGPLRSAVFSYPEWITRGPNKTFYVSFIGSDRISKIDLVNGVTTHVSGSGDRGFANGTKDQAAYHNPRGMVVRQQKLYVTDMLNDLIRVVDLD